MAAPLVLVVVDDFLVRINTAETFEEAGFEVIEARDAASALAVLQERSDVQLVCTDVHMPGELDGIDLAVRVREHHPQLKVIVISGCSKKPDLPTSIPFLTNPFVPKRLVDFAREQLGASGERRPSMLGPERFNRGG
jgi:DNA-binding NtrC family response regulator